ncbi:disease resistance At4g27190-like [Olea europaea subsp. europaea]|uniref:Disease resistance At4g27190-like n=1 Tax=Olea europaea subsp. europaea TaxID=158383 RepID=A0A8S0TF87_OLEEU|nr:disease resistance At4g27190-like [Olea europaea subsp. europaea]
MAIDIVFSIVGKLAEYAIDPILCQFKYMIFYNRKIQTLRDTVKDLEIKESDVRQLVVQAERNMEAIKSDVKDWLQKVDDLKKQADEVLEGATYSEMQCLFLRCPNLKTRCSLGRKATKKIVEVAKLRLESKFEKVGERKPMAQMPYQNPGDFVAFETRISKKKEIMEALKDKDVSIIGICGMPGVGKTTIANEISQEAEDDKLFDEFAWVDVSREPNVTKIQGELAVVLGLEIEDITNETMRARRLGERLGGNKSKSILVILDDVWEDNVLEKIGIPSARYDKMLKILLTSRLEDVCKNMGAKKIFSIDLLNEKESWELFKEKAEIYDDATDVIKDTAEKIVKECDRLPLALVIVGRALSKKAEHVWKNALEELRNSRVANIKGVQKLVYSRIELSYNYLESDEAKSLLLLCSLYAEDDMIAIENLVRYAWGLELFRGTTTLITTRDKVNTIVDDLKSCYLLLPAKDKDCVRLHDVIRDVCLQIASKDGHAYMSKHIGLKEWPKDDDDVSYSAISLTMNELNQLPSGLEYPNLKFLRVECTQLYSSLKLNISKKNFADMKELRVLDFQRMTIQISSSMQLLTKLRTLNLVHCTLQIENSTIGNLKRLEVLNFYDSNLDHFPDDIAELSNLRSLDLRFSSYCPLPPGIFSKLKKLEELYMGIFEIKDVELKQRECIIQEISSLSGLNTFQICTNDSQFLLQILHVLCIEKLERFHIELTGFGENGYYYFRRRLYLSLTGNMDESVLSQLAITSLMRRTDHLSIDIYHSPQVIERKNMLDENAFWCLNRNHPTGAFDRLQEINLYGISRMKHLWRGVIKPPSLHNLRSLNMRKCPSLESLFSESVALCMVNLQSLSISDCEMLDEIVSMDIEENEVTRMLEFPKLQNILLQNLRNFKSFICGSNNMPQPMFKQVTFPNLESLYVRKLGRTVKILDELKQIRSHKLRKLDVECLDDVSILFEYTKDDAEISILSQLKILMVRFLPKLVHITRMFPKGINIFENLTGLQVRECDNLRYLFTPSIANTLVALNVLWVGKCGAIEEIIGRQEEDDSSNIEIVEEGIRRRIEFSKLRDLTLIHLDRFRMISSQNYELVFSSLEHLHIENCPVMTKLCLRQLSAPKLQKVLIEGGNYVDISNFLDSEGSIQV